MQTIGYTNLRRGGDNIPMAISVVPYFVEIWWVMGWTMLIRASTYPRSESLYNGLPDHMCVLHVIGARHQRRLLQYYETAEKPHIHGSR